MNWQRIILGDLVDIGYSIKEYHQDNVVAVYYKDEELGAYNESVKSVELLRVKAQSHYEGIKTPVGATQ
jgi:hypothetical protein